MGPSSYMRYVVDRNVVMRRIPVPFTIALFLGNATIWPYSKTLYCYMPYSFEIPFSLTFKDSERGRGRTTISEVWQKFRVVVRIVYYILRYTTGPRHLLRQWCKGKHTGKSALSLSFHKNTGTKTTSQYCTIAGLRSFLKVDGTSLQVAFGTLQPHQLIVKQIFPTYHPRCHVHICACRTSTASEGLSSP